MKLKVPPVVVTLVFGMLMVFLDEILPVGEYYFLGRESLARACILLAVVISILAIYRFRKAGTTSDPLSPSKATRLVTQGIYTFTRNPMYLAMLLLLLALGLILGNAFNTVTAAFFVAYMNKYQIIPEEEVLSATFGKEYRQYLLRVRRWF